MTQDVSFAAGQTKKPVVFLLVVLITGCNKPPEMPTERAPVVASSPLVSPEIAPRDDDHEPPHAAAEDPMIPPPWTQVRVSLAQSRGSMVFYPPTTRDRPVPIVMSFHGMCASAELECPFYVEGSTDQSWLLCPDGNTPCDGGGLMWAGSAKKQAEIQDESVKTLRAMYPENTRAGGVLVGYSLGANAALAMLARQAPGAWTGLVIINSSTVPTPEELHRAGVNRVALVAGDHDMTAGALSMAAPKLRKAGLNVRYFSLGKVGHFFDESTSQRMIAPLHWVAQVGSTASAERTATSRSSIE